MTSESDFNLKFHNSMMNNKWKTINYIGNLFLI